MSKDILKTTLRLKCFDETGPWNDTWVVFLNKMSSRIHLSMIKSTANDFVNDGSSLLINYSFRKGDQLKVQVETKRLSNLYSLISNLDGSKIGRVTTVACEMLHVYSDCNRYFGRFTFGRIHNTKEQIFL